MCVGSDLPVAGMRLLWASTSWTSSSSSSCRDRRARLLWLNFRRARVLSVCMRSLGLAIDIVLICNDNRMGGGFVIIIISSTVFFIIILFFLKSRLHRHLQARFRWLSIALLVSAMMCDCPCLLALDSWRWSTWCVSVFPSGWCPDWDPRQRPGACGACNAPAKTSPRRSGLWSLAMAGPGSTMEYISTP